MTTHPDTVAIQSGRAAGISYLRRPAPAQPAGRLVLLHGIGSNAGSFAPLLRALPQEIDALAWNAPGYGESDPLPAPAPLPRDYAEALLRLLDALGLDRVALAGHSLGALFAASFAAAHPQRVAAVALLSPALGYRVPAGSALPAPVQARIDEIRTLGPAEFARTRAPRLVHDAAHRPAIVAAVESAMASVNVDGYVQAVRALGGGDLLADAARIGAPALVAVGTADVITPPAKARAAHAALAGATWCELPDAGHAVAQEQPQAVADFIAGFLVRRAQVPCHV